MKILYIPLIAASTLLTVAGCQQHTASTTDTQPETSQPQEQSNLVADSKLPVSDATKAFNDNDMRFLGIQTRGLTMPGVKVADQPLIIERYGVRLFGQGKDVIRNEKEKAAMLGESNYVEQYNKTMLELINQSK